MRNANAIPSSTGATIRIAGAPPHHGWAVRYRSGVPELDAAKGPLWISQFPPQQGWATFGENPWLWESEADANKIVDFLREQIEVETEVEHV